MASGVEFTPGGSFVPKLRYSKRQVTKRPFVLVASQSTAAVSSKGSGILPETRSLSQPAAKRRGSTHISPIAQYVVASSHNGNPSLNRSSHQALAERSRSSPLAQLIEEHENVAPDELGSVAPQPEQQSSIAQKNKSNAGSTRKQRVQVTPVNTSGPGDVSVSFLASTPKPGKQQLSRKRPSTGKLTPRKTSPKAKKTVSSPSSKQIALKQSFSSASNTRSLRSSDSSNLTVPSGKANKKDTFATPQLRHNETHLRKSSLFPSQKDSEASIENFLKKRANPRGDEMPSSESRAQVTSPVGKQSRGASSTSRQSKSDKGPALTDQTMLVWEGGDVKRRRQDLCDLDVILTCVTEVCQSELDVCRTPAEEKAVKCMEKYLVEDITDKIKEAQSVRTLQSKTRMVQASLKKKKEKLFSLQQERIGMSHLVTMVAEKEQHNRNMTQINKFLADLKAVIDTC